MKVIVTGNHVYLELTTEEKRAILSAVQMTPYTPRAVLDALAGRYSAGFSMDVKQVIADMLANDHSDPHATTSE